MNISAATLAYAHMHREDDPRALALKRAPGDVVLGDALQQITGWQIARRKLPRWAACDDILYPQRLSMEQCSSEIAADYKACIASSLFTGSSAKCFTDLTGGLGVDFASLASLFNDATYVERQSSLCALARHNMAALGLDNVRIVESEAEKILPDLQHQTMIFLDPSRRDAATGRKVFLTADCRPDVSALHDLLVEKADVVMLKMSPMLDIRDSLRTLPSTRQVHVVSVGGECKELLLLLSREPLQVPLRIIATDTRHHFTFTYDEEIDAEVHYTDTLGTYLYEPNASVMKAGAFRTVAARFGLAKLHPDSHLYTSDEQIAEFPGRAFRVLATFTLRAAKAALHDVTRANVVTRNFPMPACELRQRLHLKDGSSHYVFGTTVSDLRHVLILAVPV